MFLFMSMTKLSKGQEREERTKMGQGMICSVVGLLLCLVPFVNLILSAIGFIRICGRLTERHRVRRLVYLILSGVILVVSVGVLMGEIYIFSRRPTIMSDLGTLSLEVLSGEKTFDQGKEEFVSWITAPEGTGTEDPNYQFESGMDYTGMDNPGLGSGYLDDPEANAGQLEGDPADLTDVNWGEETVDPVEEPATDEIQDPAAEDVPADETASEETPAPEGVDVPPLDELPDGLDFSGAVG